MAPAPLYVAPEFRRKGAGRQLVPQALDHAFSWSRVRQVNLGVNAANDAAVALYEAMGFTPFGVERGSMPVDGELQDEIHRVRVNEDA